MQCPDCGGATGGPVPIGPEEPWYAEPTPPELQTLVGRNGPRASTRLERTDSSCDQ